MKETHYLLTEVCEKVGVRKEFILQCIRSQWIKPVGPELGEMDEEDLARLHLILELKEDFGANDEAIPIILHLIDQLYYLHSQIEMRFKKTG